MIIAKCVRNNLFSSTCYRLDWTKMNTVELLTQDFLSHHEEFMYWDRSRFLDNGKKYTSAIPSLWMYAGALLHVQVWPLFLSVCRSRKVVIAYWSCMPSQKWRFESKAGNKACSGRLLHQQLSSIHAATRHTNALVNNLASTVYTYTNDMIMNFWMTQYHICATHISTQVHVQYYRKH